MNIKKIAIIGPESTGKTTLARELSEHFGAAMVPEFARAFLEKRGPEYSYEDLREIAEGQLRLEAEAVSFLMNNRNKPFIFSDTDLNVIRIWSEIVFDRCENFILTSLAARTHDHYLLTFPDLAWEPDPLREYPDEKQRVRHYYHYLDTLVNQHIPFTIIRGQGAERTRHAVQAVSYLFQ